MLARNMLVQTGPLSPLMPVPDDRDTQFDPIPDRQDSHHLMAIAVVCLCLAPVGLFVAVFGRQTASLVAFGSLAFWIFGLIGAGCFVWALLPPWTRIKRRRLGMR